MLDERRFGHAERIWLRETERVKTRHQKRLLRIGLVAAVCVAGVAAVAIKFL